MDGFRNRFSQKRVQAVIMTVVILILAMTATVPVLAAPGSGLKPHVAIGYWLGGNGGTNKTLGQMSPKWDVINVSFIETRGNYYTPFLNMDLSAVYPGTEDEQKAAFKADIKYWQAKGKKVVISCGGQNGVVLFRNEGEGKIFLDGLKAIIDEYGFDGFDVDFEGSSIASMNQDRIGNLVTQQSINLKNILFDLNRTYGSDFIISAAPEYCYVQGGAISTGNFGAFLPVLDACRDILTYIHPQYYNGWNGDFTWLEESAQAGPSFSQVYSAEGYVRLSEMLITGFVTKDKGTFAGLRPDQVAFGVPARNGAGNGAQPVSVYADALETLLEKYPTYRGIMTWSIGWDESGGNNFINTIDEITDRANGDEDVNTDAQTPVITTQPSNQTVNVNEPVTLTVVATVSRGTLSYQWYTGSGNAISGATGATYYPPTGIPGTYTYYCVITNTDTGATGDQTVEITSRTATVVVRNNNQTDAEVPVITSQPTSQSVPEGGNVTLSVTATVSKGMLSYQWYTDSGAISGATGATYNPPTGIAGTYTYYCIVTNTDVTATGNQTVQTTSDTVTVTVNPVTGAAQWQDDVVYTAGNIVVYNGQTYRCKWWSLGDIPGADEWGPWELYP